jgi:probable HAF family extracellular repeat protein
MLAQKLLPLFLFLAPFAADATPTYSVTVVGPANSYANGMNDAGQVVGSWGWGSGSFLYSNGSIISIDAGSSTTAKSINNAGVVVGSFRGQYTQQGFSYSNGVVHRFDAIPEYAAVPASINDAGQMVGYSVNYMHTPSHLWVDANGGAMSATFNGYLSGGTAINNNGDFVGLAAKTMGSQEHAMVSVGGRVTDIGTLGGSYSTANDINDLAQVVGVAETSMSDTGLHAFLYAGGAMTDLGALAGDSLSQAFAINNLGQVVGGSFSSSWDSGHAFLYSGGSMVDLNQLVDPATGWTLVRATDINNNGQIAALAFKDGVGFAVRLDLASAVPEPANVAMLAGGLLLFGLGALRGRRACRAGTSEPVHTSTGRT